MQEPGRLSRDHELQTPATSIVNAFSSEGEEVTAATNIRWLFKVKELSQGSYHGIRIQFCIQEHTGYCIQICVHMFT